MCGIVGFFGFDDAFEKTIKAISIMKNRGSDSFGISNFDQTWYNSNFDSFISLLENNSSNHCKMNFFGHNLHAVVNHVPQPLIGNENNFLVTNCEIYNWKELNEKYNLNAKNDAELILYLIEKFGIEKIKELDGVYAFAYYGSFKNQIGELGNKYKKLILARDLIGVKPLWYYFDRTKFSFASERKSLVNLGLNKKNVQELNPRQILELTCKDIYSNNGDKDKSENKNNKYNKNDFEKISDKDFPFELNFKTRNFFDIEPEHNLEEKELMLNVQKLLHQSIKKRIPERKIGLLFSGGIDSTYIANYLKNEKVEFTCYTAAFEVESGKEPEDLIYAKKVAQQLGLKLKIKTIKLDDIPEYLKKIVPLIEDNNVTKTSVALTFYLACELAKNDNCKVIFSGLGSEEIFAGYERHKCSPNINKECISGLIKMYERDLYRDDVISMDNKLELRIPFLDKELVEFCLKIPTRFKVGEGFGKLILRKISEQEGIDHEFSFRKKKAAQYGSKLDHALGRLTRKNGFKFKSQYLTKFYPGPNLRLGVLFSSGKDSTYAAYIMKKQNYELTCLITLKSKNPDSYMFHTPAIDLAKVQADAMDVPILMQETDGFKEEELCDLEKALIIAKEKYFIEGIVTGAVFSTYQRSRIEKICDRLGLKIFSPLWHKPQQKLMEELISHNFEIIFTSIAAYGLDKSWLNKVIDKEDLIRLNNLKDKIGSNQAGEGGEFESLVLDCPLFKKKLQIIDSDILQDSEYSARLIVKKAELVDK
ncbi:diphthine--ammonia ligase [archaeon]|jgi:diphthine-ammonia ligase|nr:diphthine--ammonia ligase [archaeon]MBT3450755.1 diphthine--ammonia ligase [archaeon]MBT6869518.1 diphthine--ammonia ligase [archaeon]MBT7193683.1 diphthine--ammonia ligase [archaeon]MBT7380374.1 diphthine--ammonia ligase [archaeon]